MLRQSDFEKALVLSFLLHMTWMVAVTVVVLPGRYRMSRSPEMTFLGPILDEVSFPEVIGKGFSLMPSAGKVPRLLFGKAVAPRFFPEESVLPRAMAAVDKPQVQPRRRKPELAEAAAGREPPAGEGERPYGVGRVLEYRPPLPEYTGWTEGEEAVLIVGLSFRVDGEGKVWMVEVIRSSGYPEVDLLAKKHLRVWLFSPADPGSEKREEQGTALISLRARGGVLSDGD
jgi:TonB family protein